MVPAVFIEGIEHETPIKKQAIDNSIACLVRATVDKVARGSVSAV
jgi:hypothetical protein